MNSKFIGMVFDGWKVCGCFLKNNYNKIYNNSKQKQHHAYSFFLVNIKNTNQTLTLSGNTLRLISNGTRKFSDILSCSKGGKNVQLNTLKKSLRK